MTLRGQKMWEDLRLMLLTLAKRPWLQTALKWAAQKCMSGRREGGGMEGEKYKE